MASDVSSNTSVPEIPPDSPGSSVSTRLQDEYDELLKYAVVVPKFDSSKTAPKVTSQPQSSSATTEKLDTNTNANYPSDNPTPRTQMEIIYSGSTTQKHSSDNSSFQPQNADSQTVQTEDNSNSNSTNSDTLEKPDLGTGSNFKQFMWKSTNQTEYQSLDVEYEESGENLVYTATVDADIGRVDNLLDQWTLDLKRNVLAEFGQAKIRIVENNRRDMTKEKERHACENNKLLNEIDSLKELLHTYEKSMQRKDDVISNLTHAMQKQKDRKDMMKQFCDWKIKFNDAKREAFTSKLAKNHYERNLSQKVWSAWHSIIESRWRSKVERACQTKAQEVCMQLTNDYEAKIAALNEDLDKHRDEIRLLHSERDRYEETMKKAFMRGVCALNLEAMNMFHGSEEETTGAASGKAQSYDFYSENLDGNGPQKDYGASKTIPRDSTESLPTRIITSQSSRPHSSSNTQSRSVISKQSSGTSTSKSRPNSAKSSSKPISSHPTSRTGSMGPTTLAPPMASVVVERHPPVNKQTIGQATASKYPKTSQVETHKVYKRLAGQTSITVTPHLQSVKVVE